MDHSHNCYSGDSPDRALGIHVSQKEDLDEAMKKVLHHKGTALLEIVTEAALV